MRGHSVVALVVACATVTRGTALGRAGPQSAVHLPLLRFRGGADAGAATITVRVRTPDGLKRATLPADATLMELQRLLQREHKFPLARQTLSRNPSSEPMETERALSDLGIEHGTMLHLKLAPATTSSTTPKGSAAPEAEADASSAPASSEIATSASTSSAAARGRRRRRSQTMAELEEERKAFEVVLETPPAARCDYLSVAPAAGKEFADFVLDNEFEDRRIALLYGRWESDTEREKRGVQVDVVYEPPQACDEATMEIAHGEAAAAEVRRASALAEALGLRLVGFAYAHPPRYHTMEAAELAHIVTHRTAAVAADPEAASLFVGVRFRAVLEGEAIDGEVTAEAYQPTEQATELVGKGVLIDCAAEEGHAALTEASGLQFKLGPELQSSADLSYFVSRVHDLAKPYVPPPFGAFRHTFPHANRGGAPLRKFHLRTFLERQREAGVPFREVAVDFQLLMHVASLMPTPLFNELCAALPKAADSGSRKAREEGGRALLKVERWLCEYAGIPPPPSA